MAQLTQVDPVIFDFLKKLKKNNDRDWFAANKGTYEEAKERFEQFSNRVLNEVTHHDEIEELKTFRIYRDVRFSKNKDPYKVNMSFSLKRATKWRRGGCYVHIEPGNCFVAGGFWDPNKEDLTRIRQELASDAAPLRKIINGAAFKKRFGQLEGEQLKSAPRDYPKDHPNVDLLRYKQMILIERFKDEEAMQSSFAKKVSESFKAMRPFFDYMSEVLTTDENGVPIE